MEKISSIDIKNNFIRNLNLAYKNTDCFINTLYNITHQKLIINNIIKIYYDKIISIEEELQKENINFWDLDFTLRIPLEMDLMNMLIYSLDILDNLREKMTPLIMISYACTGKIANVLLKKELVKYQEICNYIAHYDFKNNIDQSIIYHFKNEHNYQCFLPGSFKKLWDSEQLDLKKLNMTNKILELDKVLIPIIENQETTTAIFHDLKKDNSVLKRLKKIK